MKKISLLVIVLLMLSGCVSTGNYLGYGSSTVVGLEISTGQTELLVPVSLTLGFKRYEALVCPIDDTEIPSILTNVNGQVGAGVGITTTGQQSLAIGKAADNLSKKTK